MALKGTSNILVSERQSSLTLMCRDVRDDDVSPRIGRADSKDVRCRSGSPGRGRDGACFPLALKAVGGTLLRMRQQEGQ